MEFPLSFSSTCSKKRKTLREKENQALRERAFKEEEERESKKVEKRVPAVGQREATRAEKKRGAFVSLSLAPRWLRLGKNQLCCTRSKAAALSLFLSHKQTLFLLSLPRTRKAKKKKKNMKSAKLKKKGKVRGPTKNNGREFFLRSLSLSLSFSPFSNSVAAFQEKAHC